MKISFGMGSLIVGVFLISGAALASHGRVGLWRITTRMDMPNMTQIPPEQLAKMREMGIQMPMGNTITTEHCMTAAEVANDRPPSTGREKDCTVENIKIAGGTYNADMVCKGEMNGKGHVQVSYESADHYAGKLQFSGIAHGHAAAMTSTFEGKFISASCGPVTH